MAKKGKKRRAGVATRRQMVFDRFGGVCQYCRRLCSLSKICAPTTATIDHILPRSKGGGNHFHNLTLACRDCNQARGDLPYETFVALVDRLDIHWKNGRLATDVLRGRIDDAAISGSLVTQGEPEKSPTFQNERAMLLKNKACGYDVMVACQLPKHYTNEEN